MEKISKDDPRFTAKALGEQSEELENVEITSEDLKEFEESLALAKELENEFGNSESEETLSEDQISDLGKRFEERDSKWKLLMFPGWVYNLAACVAIGAVGVVMYNDKGLFEEEPKRPAPMDTIAEVDQVSVNEEVFQNSENSFVSGDANGALGNFEQPPVVQIAEVGVAYTQVRAEASKMRLNNTRYFEDAGTLPLVESIETLGNGSQPNYNPSIAISESTPRIRGLSSGETASSTIVLNARAVPFRSFSGDFEDERESRVRGYAPGASHMQAQQLSVSIPAPPANREGYDHIEENDFRSVLDNPLSTFSIDVDTASYSNMRRMIEGGARPLPDAIRIEELINYFKYDYAEPTGDTPFSVNIESASAPWRSEHQLVRIGLKGMTIAQDERPAANLVFLVDVSGSMGQQNKLPLAQEALKLLVEQMGSDDRIAIVVYAGSSGLVLPSTTANNQETIQHAIDNLRSGGSTNGGAGIELAYKVATEKFIDGGINRVVLCTDGDFNVGVTDDGRLVRLIEEKAKSGVFFSAIGFGDGNYQDGKMEQLSNKGNGNYAYIDGKQEARKVFVDDMLGTLHTIAKDVKIQVDFNPAEVTAYRLIGYVNRKLAKEDFNDDKKDAGEIGAGHTVTALYEVVPVGVEFDTKGVDASKYQRPATKTTGSEEWLTVKLRYKVPDEDVSQLVDFPYTGDVERAFKNASPDFRFASSVAGFGMLLRDSTHKGNLEIDDVIEIARAARSKDSNGLKSEFVELVRKAKALKEE
jgi:Ca-activated chloride channel family protein